MRNRKNRLLTILIVGLLAVSALVAGYFVFNENFSTDNRNKAAVVKNIDVTFEKASQQVTPGTAFTVKVFFDTGAFPDRKITGATIPLKYPANLVEVDTATTQSSQPAECNRLSTVLGVFDNNTTGVVKLSKVTLDTNESNYPTGKFCIGTVTFRLKSGVTSIDNYIDFDDANADFEIVGKDTTGNLSYGKTTTGRLRIFTSAAVTPTTAPTVTTMPTVTNSPTITSVPTVTNSPTITMMPTVTTGITNYPTITSNPTTPPQNTTYPTTGNIFTPTTYFTPPKGGNSNNNLPNTSVGDSLNLPLIVTGVSLIALALIISSRRFR